MNQRIDLLAFSFSHTHFCFSLSLSVCCICMDPSCYSEYQLRWAQERGTERGGCSEEERKAAEEEAVVSPVQVLSWWPHSSSSSSGGRGVLEGTSRGGKIKHLDPDAAVTLLPLTREEISKRTFVFCLK